MIISKRSLLTAIAVTSVSASLILVSTSVHARIKCWKNSDGVRECGKTIPPEYSQQGYEEVSGQGITVEKIERAPTEEERQEEKRLAAIQQAKEAEKAEKVAQDKALLDTYTNTDDIQMAGDGKVAVLESTINLAERRNQKIQVTLDKRTAVAVAAELAGKQPAEGLLEDIESLQRQIRNNDKFIADKREEQENIKKKYAEKIERFEQLTQIKISDT